MSTDDDRDAVKSLLLEDYRTIQQSFWNNEQAGETRVNWFIGIVTAVVGGLVGLASMEHGLKGGDLRLIVGGGLTALLALGMVTLCRMKKRNAVTDGYKESTAAIRRFFKDHFDDARILRGYQPFGPRSSDGNALERLIAKMLPATMRFRGRGFGGLADTVLTINTLLLTGLVGFMILPVFANTECPATFTPIQTAGVLTAVAILSFAAQFIFARVRMEPPSHAGGVVFRMHEGKVEYLIVGPGKGGSNEWLLPKGHLERSRGEDPREAAIREVGEEAGVKARPICRAGIDCFVLHYEKVVVVYYLMEYLGEVAREETRAIAWHGPSEARDMLRHDGSKKILAKAERIRTALAKG